MNEGDRAIQTEGKSSPLEDAGSPAMSKLDFHQTSVHAEARGQQMFAF
jgi:hypothetical protein